MISLVIPTLNEEKNIQKIIKILLKIKIIKEAIFVDDNSEDRTTDYIKKYKNYKKIKLIVRSNKKRDLSKSVLDGVLQCKNNIIGVMDCDLQHHPKYFIKMFKILKKNKNCELIVASRFLNKNGRNITSLRTFFSIFFISFFHLFFKKKVSDPLSGFFLFKKDLITNYKSNFFLKGYKILFDILYNGKKNINLREIHIFFYKRRFEKSKFNFKIFILIIFQMFYSKFKVFK